MTLRMRSDVSTAKTEYGIVLLDERTSRYYQLTLSAGPIVDAITAGEGTEGAVRRLTSAYPVTSETAARDVARLLDKLRSIGLVTP